MKIGLVIYLAVWARFKFQLGPEVCELLSTQIMGRGINMKIHLYPIIR